MKKPMLYLTTMILITSVMSSPNSIAKYRCSKAELKLYQKAKYQFMLSNTQIDLSYQLKELIRQKYEGSLRDYQPQDIYLLEKADKDLDEWRVHRSEWEPALRTMAKRCGYKMTSRRELLP